MWSAFPTTCAATSRRYGTCPFPCRRSLDGPLRLASSLEGTSGPGLTWMRMVRLLRREFDNPGSLLFDPMVVERYWRGLIGGLLLSVDHQYASELLAPARPARPEMMKRRPFSFGAM